MAFPDPLQYPFLNTTMSLYRSIIRPLLFQMDPEAAHHLSVRASAVAGRLPLLPGLCSRILSYDAPCLETTAAGLKFRNPIGLAAGWDKSGESLKMLDHLGLGFAEIGSISARPSVGNPKPRLFRLPSEQATIVNYGLPNDGAEVIAKRLKAHHSRNPLGVNIVKTNDGPGAAPSNADEILQDYATSVRLVHEHADYLMLNLSCPNAEGGKDFFAEPENIRLLLESLADITLKHPVFLKLSPNPEPRWLEKVLGICLPYEWVRGFSFNLPPGKPDTLTLTCTRDSLANRPGAVSGKPVSALINQCIGTLYPMLPKDRFHIIASGGVFNADDALEKIQLGASLIQIYTSLIYEGPGIAKIIANGLTELLRNKEFQSISDAVGSGLDS